MISKKIAYFIIAVLTVAGCTGRQSGGAATEADSLYTYSYILRHHIQEPERCLALIDTAEMRGMMSVDSCNWMRGTIYNVALNDYAHVEEYLRRVLDRPRLSHSSDVYLSALSTYCTFNLKIYENARALEYAIEGARLAHDTGDARFEAEFYGIAGAAMEHERPGAGIEYIDRAIALIRQQNVPRMLAKISFYQSEKTRIQMEQKMYEEAATTCRERQALIEEMQAKEVEMPEGYYDVQQARNYAKLAYCLQKLGRPAEARQAAEAFDRTDFSKTIKGKLDIQHYFTLTDDRQRVMQLYDDLERYYLQQSDTVSESFRSVIVDKAQWHRSHREWREADMNTMRAAVLAESITLRDRNRQASEFEAQFKTQEARIALSEAEATARIHLIIIIALVAILAVGAFALWRIVLAQRRLHQKNRTLFDTVQQMLKKEEDTREKALAGQSFETLTASQQLYRKTCDLMRDKQPYTESTLNREALAQMLGTNYNLVADAIRECTGGMTLSDFLDDWRIRHAAQMLADTDEPVGLVTEMSGFASRSHFNTLFREKFKMTPTEYRKVAKEKNG